MQKLIPGFETDAVTVDQIVGFAVGELIDPLSKRMSPVRLNKRCS